MLAKQVCKIKNKMLESILLLSVMDWIPATGGMTVTYDFWNRINELLQE
jgi:hypothetical protein